MKPTFIQIFKDNIKRTGSEKLLEWLMRTDFFGAPASTKYHLDCPEGLVTHSVHVYTRLRSLYLMEKDDGSGPVILTPEEEESIAICGLLHDINKTQFYKLEMKSRKTGEVQSNGKPVWENYWGWEIEDKIPIGHGEKSIFLISQFMRLSFEEMLAIRWHMGLSGDYVANKTMSTAFESCPLAVLLHSADMQATYLDEVKEKRPLFSRTSIIK